VVVVCWGCRGGGGGGDGAVVVVVLWGGGGGGGGLASLSQRLVGLSSVPSLVSLILLIKTSTAWGSYPCPDFCFLDAGMSN